MRRRAFTLVEMLVVIMLIMMLLGILLPGLERAWEVIRQRKCQAQLQGLFKALVNYGVDSGTKERWPDAGRTVSGVDGANTTGDINTKGSLWLLVIKGYAQADNFVCPTDEVAKGVSPYDGPVAMTTFSFPRNLANKRPTLSYSYQIPHQDVPATRKKLANPGYDHSNPTRFAIMADRNPFDKPPPVLATDPGVPPGLVFNTVNPTKYAKATSGAGSKSGDNLIKYVRSLTLKEQAGVNSPCHRGEGQNVLFRDGHVDFFRTPIAGVDYDNIYTRAGSAANTNDTDKTLRAIGTTPTSNSGGAYASDPYDSDDWYLRTYPWP